MEIKFKRIEHERDLDAPFIGALICAVGCHRNCKGCINRHLKKEPNLSASAEEIVSEILSNPFNEGIILGGLEWLEQPMEMLELCKEASSRGLKIMIYTGFDLDLFQANVGRYCANKVGFDSSITDKMLAENDITFHAMVGAMILDTYIPTEYYIKCGEYIQDLKVEDNIQFGVKLATANQKIYRFNAVED